MNRSTDTERGRRNVRRFGVIGEAWVGPAVLLIGVVGVLIERAVYLNQSIVV